MQNGVPAWKTVNCEFSDRLPRPPSLVVVVVPYHSLVDRSCQAANELSIYPSIHLLLVAATRENALRFTVQTNFHCRMFWSAVALDCAHSLLEFQPGEE